MSRRSRPWAPGTPCYADLWTTDAAGARAFYAGLFGWEVQEGPPEFGGYAVARQDGAAVAGIGSTMAPDQPSAWQLYLATDDAAATATAALEAGGSVVAGPAQIPGSGTMLVVADPAGATSGAWQHGPFIGAELVNEPGAFVWEDLRSPDPDASRAFLAAVFGLRHETMPGLPPDYTTLELDEPFPLGGVGPLWGSAPGWIVYFGTPDVEASAATATDLGARHVSDVTDSPYGKMATVTDPTGAVFILSQNTGQPQPDRA